MIEIERERYGSIRPKRATHERFEKLRWAMAAKKKGKVTQDEALDALLKKAGY